MRNMAPAGGFGTPANGFGTLLALICSLLVVFWKNVF